MARSDVPGSPATSWRDGLRRAAEVVGRALRQRPGAQEPGPAEDLEPPEDLYTYSPVDDEHPDPGEVVWAWVPFEENARKGKDRPVLVIGRDGATLLALQLTSKDHDRDAAQEAAAGRLWMDIGAGGWDRYRRPSEARVNRILRLEESAVRRAGVALDREIFEEVLAQVRRHDGGR
ncbi:type II toxin-antitoxin system PemK/MazF family toxin [Ornithinimicrobium panacihumi]|uniref:type II toxin-antitoxin system PemK/MazF family toxin n=1 Tax=Ornithinimicrobium panacihumi TaxID=2008449 RepID=UPI003F88CA96